ncbi:hypothetical protein NoPa_00138 [Pseudomonas phage vB_PpuM-NoPa]|uniref:Uncharacterized protein n=3 Tax=Tartuvirus TaxID=3424912 RepID=A0AAX4MWL2_9CAUD
MWYSAGGLASGILPVQIQDVEVIGMKSLKFALALTAVCAIVLVVFFGSLVLTHYLFSLFVVMTEGWQIIAGLVWMLELIFVSALTYEILE